MSQDHIATLFDQGEEQGCVNLSYLNEVVTELELDEQEIERLYDQLEERGIDITDDCRRPTATIDEATYVNSDLVAATTMTQVGRHAWYSYGASTSHKRDVRGSNAIQWRMITDALVPTSKISS